MSQLNLKQILSGDNLSTVVDKLNYNFDQIILNGGGPQGLRGLIGSPGLPGLQGPAGETGPTGEHGTYIFAENTDPYTFPFGASGGPTPRTGDIFLETDPSYINIYELGPTGWYIVETIQAPSGSMKSVYHQSGSLTGPLYTDSTLDPLLSSKMFIGSSGAFETGPDSTARPYLFSNFLTDTFNSSLSLPSPFADSLTVLASESNQLRILSNDLAGATGALGATAAYPPTVQSSRGGVVHSLKATNAPGTIVQAYEIINADSVGDKFFNLNMNSGRGTSLLYGDMRNRALIGLPAYSFELKAGLSVGNSLAVGNQSFVQSAVFANSTGAVIGGNLSVGFNNNSYHTGTFRSSSVSSVLIDSAISVGSPNESILAISSGALDGTLEQNAWFFRHSSQKSVTNYHYRSLKLTAQYYGITGGTGNSYRDVMFMSLTGGNNFGNNLVNPSIGVANYSPWALFEIGSEANANRLSIGDMGGGSLSYDATQYIGFNLHRSPVQDVWIRRNDGVNNAGKAIWSGMSTGNLNVSFFPSTGATNSILTDQQVTAATKFMMRNDGGVFIDPDGPPMYLQPVTMGLLVAFGATGSTGDMPNDINSVLPGQTFYRRPVAYFGRWNTASSPMIYHTNGLTQSTSVSGNDNVSVLPQYSFYGANTTGMFLGNALNGNPGAFGTDSAVTGLAIGGTAGLTLAGNIFYGARLGINNRDPLERVHIGDQLVIHDGGTKFIGYNVYWNGSGDRRILGSTASGATQQGYARIKFFNLGATSTSATSRFRPFGAVMTLEAAGLGGTGTTASQYSPNGRIFGGVTITPGLAGATSSMFNLAPLVPQVSIGLTQDVDTTTTYGQDSNTTAKRGTLNIAAQQRAKNSLAGPFGLTIEDNYNIGLYSYEGFPVAAMGVAGGAGFANKTLSLNFIGSTGDAIMEDIPILYAESNANLTTEFQKRAYFGSNFRVGINAVPNQIFGVLNTTNGYDVAPLVVAGATAFSSVSVHYASIMKGSLLVDQTPYGQGNGGDEGIWIKDGSICTTGPQAFGARRVGLVETPKAPNTYIGDWGIQYYKVSNSQAGLNFWKPGSNALMFIDDTGSVGIGTTNFSYTTALGTNVATGSPTDALVGKVILGKGFHYYNSSSSFFRGQGYLSPTAAAAGAWTSASTPPPGTAGTYQSKLAVDGIAKFIGIFNTSDKRLKNELAIFEPGAALEKIMKLRPVLYEWKPEFNPTLNGKIELGFIAQEVEEILPEAVHLTKTDNFEDERSLEYNAIFVAAVGAIKDQQEIIEKQSEKIKNLEDKLSRIEELLAKHNIQ